MNEFNSGMFNQLDQIVQKGYKDNAIGFANWLLKNCEIVKIFGDLMYLSQIDGNYYTTEQLYNLYLESL